MKTTCLINSWNYRRHVGEAIESALSQTVPFDKIVVVDDGSTDGSVEYLQSNFDSNPKVVVIPKPHGGQLSCFNRGIAEVRTELVCFLDADDRYRPNYLESVIREYEQRPNVDFLSVSSVAFGANENCNSVRASCTRDRGFSVSGALLGSHWVGERTSCLSMRTSVARKVLPYPYESEWITRADDVLVFGASVVGAYKRHLNQGLVEYRVHEHNHFANQQFGDVVKFRRSVAINRLCGWFAEKMGYEISLLPDTLHREFRTCQKPTIREWWSYQKLSFSVSRSWAAVFRNMVTFSLHYANQRLTSANQDISPIEVETEGVPPLFQVDEPIAEAA